MAEEDNNDLIMFAYKNASKGATLLATELSIKKMKHEGSTWVPRLGRTILNWGAGWFPRESMFRCRVINHPEAIMKVVNKKDFFEGLKGAKAPRVPAFTTNERTAKGWVDDGEIVVARTVVEGARGEGIKVLKKGVDWVFAPLYTKYVTKDYEFRAHVFNGKVIAWGQRIKDGRDQKCPYIRSDQNGYELVNRISPMPECDAAEQAIKAVKYYGLDFGAVDLVVKDGLAYILEVNTAPWLGEYLVEKYAAAVREMMKAA